MRPKRIVPLVAAVCLSLGAAAPAYAINDVFVPADECSGNENAVGQPGGGPNPGLTRSPAVDAPASLNNPGQSTGAKAGEHSRGHEHCNGG